MILRKLVLVLLVIVFTLALASPLGSLYSRLLNLPQGFSSLIINSAWNNFFNGIAPAFILFLIIIFVAFGGPRKYWWIAILLVPAAVFEIYFDLEHIYFPIALGLVGWSVGYLIAKLRY